ncbi:MAG: hypothetical protein RLZZ618_3253 [Pseudomonadota bacterium]|jgi:poly(hydroxyalkanoate) depolymerase family esterase
MKIPFHLSPPSFDANAVQATIRNALASAGLDTTSGPMHDVTETIRRALSQGAAPSSVPTAASASDPDVIDVTARVVGSEPEGERAREGQRADAPASAGRATSGTFTAHVFTNRAGTRAYKLYVPAKLDTPAPPMVVMLHGCTQSADDFAAGTQMNHLADEHGFLVLYPEQPASANPSKCWNWFKPQDQMRDDGEPSLIAGIAAEVAARHGVDSRRIFVAGLSAGAAMAVVLGETHPELFAGVGAHSGLPYGSAHDIPSALAAMKGGRSGAAGLKNMTGAGAAPRKKAARAAPIIVFHGDRDHTVQQSNGADIVQQALDAHTKATLDAGLRVSTERVTRAGGRSFTRTSHTDDTGRACIESWTVHGAGHAWSGGSAKGSYTDAAGPDASAEMVRFFLALPVTGVV